MNAAKDSSSVKHLTDEDGVDFVREVMPGPEKCRAEEHLRTRCGECVRCSTFWETVVDLATRERANRVPEEVLLAAVDLFAGWRRRVFLPVRARRARPFFDSLLQPIPVGVRAGTPSPRRVLHRWGPWIVDLRMEAEPRNRLSISGQVLESGKTEPRLQLLGGIVLMRGDVIVQQTEANRFGEFQLSSEREPDLILYVELHGAPAIGVALPDVDRPVVLKNPAGSSRRPRNEAST
jgi:hypothetical protein